MGINTLHPNSSAVEFKGRTTIRSFVNPEVISTPTLDTTDLNFITQNYEQLNTDGWKIISYPFPYPMDAFTFFEDSMRANLNDIQLVKDNAGAAFWPEYNFNQIGDLLPGQGYQMKLGNGIGSNIKPKPIFAQNNGINNLNEYINALKNITIDLNEGWNIIGYYGYEPLDIEEAFDSIIDKVKIIKNNAGAAFWPSVGFNGIGDLLPGEGYQVLMNEDANGFKFEPIETDFNITPAADLNNLFA